MPFRFILSRVLSHRQTRLPRFVAWHRRARAQALRHRRTDLRERVRPSGKIYCRHPKHRARALADALAQ